MLLAHVADLHIGAGTAHGQEGDDGVSTRIRDFSATWLQICVDATRAGVDALIFAGDAFRSPRPSPTEIMGFQAGLDRLAEYDTPAVLIVGNHDWTGTPGESSALDVFADEEHEEVGRRVYVAKLPRLVTVESCALQVACLPYFRRSHVLAAYPGLSREESDRLAADLGHLAVEGLIVQAGPGPLVAAIHHNIAGSCLSGGFETATASDPVLALQRLQDLPCQYIACGHIHLAQDLGRAGGPPIVYPGSPEIVEFGEQGKVGGWVLVEIDEGPAAYQVRPVATRPFCTVELDFRGFACWSDMAGQLAAWQVPGGGPVVRVHYQVDRAQKGLVVEREMEEALLARGCSHVSGFRAICPDEERVPAPPEALTTDERIRRYIAAKWPDRVESMMDKYAELVDEAVA